MDFRTHGAKPTGAIRPRTRTLLIGGPSISDPKDRPMTAPSPSVILAGARTPIGKYRGGLATLTAADLGTAAIRVRWSAPASTRRRSTT